MDPEATMATNIEVTVELLCRVAVANNPINRAIKGLEVMEIICSAISFPKSLNERLIKSKEIKKRKKVHTIINTFCNVF